MVVVNLDIVLATPVLRALSLVVLSGLLVLYVVTMLAWSAWLRGTRFYRWLMDRMPLKRHVERVADAVHEFRGRKGAIVLAALISLAGHLGVAATFVAVASVVMPDAPWQMVAFLSMMGMVANAIPLTPGGLGVGEAAFEHLFAMMGYSGGAVLLVLWRVGMLPLATLGAALYITGQASHAGPPVSGNAPNAPKVT
jgi:hypothetical protein